MKSKFPLYILIMCGLAAVVALGFYSYTLMAPEKLKPNAQTKNEEQKNMAIVGKLITDDSRKGTPLIETADGVVFLTDDYGPKGLNKTWNGRTVEVKGTLISKVCGPYDQCLSDGSMSFLTDVVYISLVEK